MALNSLTAALGYLEPGVGPGYSEKPFAPPRLSLDFGVAPSTFTYSLLIRCAGYKAFETKLTFGKRVPGSDRFDAGIVVLTPSGSAAPSRSDGASAAVASVAPDNSKNGVTDNVSEAPTKPFLFDASTLGSAAPASACALPGFSLPAGARIYAAGAYAGAPTNVQIDDSGHHATSIRVAVNEPAAPVVLVLGAYEPTVWSVGWTRGTRIAGVLLTGYHRQQVTGLHAGVPVFVSTYDNRGPCGYAYVGGDGSSKLNTVSRAAFGLAIDTAFVAHQGQVTVGAPDGMAALITDASAREVSEFRRKDAPLAGKAGLDAAVAAGTLLPATQADAEEWARARRASAGPEDVPSMVGAPVPGVSVPHNSYLVLKPFQIPAGLYGAHSATFIVARGVPLPTGNPGHSRVLDLNTGRCNGATCNMGD